MNEITYGAGNLRGVRSMKEKKRRMNGYAWPPWAPLISLKNLQDLTRHQYYPRGWHGKRTTPPMPSRFRFCNQAMKELAVLCRLENTEVLHKSAAPSRCKATENLKLALEIWNVDNDKFIRKLWNCLPSKWSHLFPLSCLLVRKTLRVNPKTLGGGW